MADTYKVVVKVSVIYEPDNSLINAEETTFNALNFEKMTRASAEYYELITKMSKAVK